ncbi:PilZ domain-containing protein [Trichloromonas sp.]|uniref:PilZ domain-containing protein n=1 Tax=Trichloromonas sp. TaxID=3069249 RepID=UPI003D816EBC
MLRPPLYVLLVAVVFFLFWVAWRRLAGGRLQQMQKLAVPVDAEGARGAPRFPVQWAVAIGTPGGLRQGVTRNISQGGMFVEMDPPLPLGQTYPMTIGVSGGRTMQVEARVVWSISGGVPARGPAFGMGVMFTSISEPDLALVATLDHFFDEDA